MKFHKKALHLYQKSNYWKERWRIKEVPTEEELNNCNSLLLKTTFRNFVLIFSMGGSFFSGRLNCFQATIKLAWFPLDAFCDEVVNNWTNYEISMIVQERLIFLNVWLMYKKREKNNMIIPFNWNELCLYGASKSQ